MFSLVQFECGHLACGGQRDGLGVLSISVQEGFGVQWNNLNCLKKRKYLARTQVVHDTRCSASEQSPMGTASAVTGVRFWGDDHAAQVDHFAAGCSGIRQSLNAATVTGRTSLGSGHPGTTCGPSLLAKCL